MNSKSENSGWVMGVAAFMWWGFVPVYFKALDTVPALEILAHRIVWCVPVTLVFMLLLRKRVALLKIIANRKLLLGLMASTALVSSNWFIFTWAVTHGQILPTSLGYFINPIFSILLGVIFLSEKLTRLQWAAVICAFLGVVNQVVNYGEVPWISLGLAVTFGLYGFIRKQLVVDSLNGLLVETVIALPIAAGYVLWLTFNQSSSFLQGSASVDWLLLCGGIVTAVPLILFAAAARKIPLNSMGFLQFLAPSITFIMATQYYNEPLGDKQFFSFALIWLGLALYLVRPVQRLFKRKS